MRDLQTVVPLLALVLADSLSALAACFPGLGACRAVLGAASHLLNDDWMTLSAVSLQMLVLYFDSLSLSRSSFDLL